MTKRVLIIGGYGNFGSYITEKLVCEPNLQIIISGRSEEKCRACAEKFKTAPNPPEYKVLDINNGLPEALKEIAPDIVIHTSGPFQGQGYEVAEACIAQGCHYIDLADGRAFVVDIKSLDEKAKERGVAVISGASSVPCLTAAVVDHHLPEFKELTKIEYGIATVRTNTGLATTAAILGYAGKRFKTLIDGKMRNVYGWQDLTAYQYPEIGTRLLGNCDIPDLALFPERYKQLKTIRFYAGLELSSLHLGLWALSWLVRLHVLKSLAPFAATLLKISRVFDAIGSNNSAFHMKMSGVGKDGKGKTVIFYLIAKSGHGPFIPAIPSILCAKMLAQGAIQQHGAFVCMGIISLEQYLEALRGLDITSQTKISSPACGRGLR